ncbi:uncharacterized protein LOC133836858 [Drosophila sulfurigaster albostrigata]|uniref:uncharacterized protein LOC133836858 n=1 Tax=Drosophila sulfurigaster albostrigata TaxID=89887 RepID=UPI002D21AF84|nr:uncharacterized protein LOC133836858 [Drosophila sulfurigaster albostrigata]
MDGWQAGHILMHRYKRLQSSLRLLDRIKESFRQPLDAEATTLANDYISTTTTEEDNDEEDIQTDTNTETVTDDANSEETRYEDGNYFNRRKCQMLDDWGPIGLNCTDEDIVTERVEVVGFLANWLNTYLYIRIQLRLSCVTNRSFCSRTQPHKTLVAATSTVLYTTAMSHFQTLQTMLKKYNGKRRKAQAASQRSWDSLSSAQHKRGLWESVGEVENAPPSWSMTENIL